MERLMSTRKLPKVNEQYRLPVKEDWLVSSIERKAAVYCGDNDNEIIMTNGLVSRTWRIQPNAATVAFDNLMTTESIIRGIKPEAIVEIDGVKYEIGGLLGQEEYAYLRYEWLDDMSSNPDAFQFAGFEVGQTEERFSWKHKRYSASLPWPPKGVSLTLNFKAPSQNLHGVEIAVHYEMYDGIPLISKWVTIKNNSQKEIKINTFISEILAVVEHESIVGIPGNWVFPRMIQVDSDYAFGSSMVQGDAAQTTYWVPDPQYTTQTNNSSAAPVMLESRLPLGPNAEVKAGETFETFRTFELVHDSTEHERRSLTQRRMYRIIAPWVTENPIMMHVTSIDAEVVKKAIDQCAEVGFEMIILSFGSGLDMESEDVKYIERVKELVDYAHSKGIEMGGYSLLASRSISPEDDVISTKGAMFGASPCLCSKWGEDYFRKITNFIEKTGMDLLENDGSYPGDICESTKHPGHKGTEDSQWRQWKKITDFYKWCRSNGIYLNVPDWYYLTGSNKNGMGYKEVDWSLPRERQILIGRQNIYDGTWDKTPSMGWMFVPLTEYHGGGAAATIEPLCEHLDTYEAHMINNFGAGVQACYRGTRLYDTKETKAVVKSTIDFYKKYHDILDSDIIHVRRPDGRDIDCILHVNPNLNIKGMAIVHNPLDTVVEKTIKLPLYYTGLTDKALVVDKDDVAKEYELDRMFNIYLPVKVNPRSTDWFIIK